MNEVSDAVRPVDRWNQPSLCRGYQGRGHRARLSGICGRCGGDPGSRINEETQQSVLGHWDPVLATLPVLPLHRRPRDTKCPLLVASVLVPGVVERFAKNVLRVWGQV